MKKILLICLLPIYLFSTNLSFKFLKMKDLFFFLEKDGYNLNYYLSNDKLNQLFDLSIKNQNNSINIKDILKNSLKSTIFKYKITNKNIVFYPSGNIFKKNIKDNIKENKEEKCLFKANHKLSDYCQIRFVLNILAYSKNVSNLNHVKNIITFDLSNTFSNEKLIRKINYLYKNNFNILLKIKMLYIDNIVLNINKNNYKIFLRNIKKENIYLDLSQFNVKTFKYQDLDVLDNNIQATKKIMTKYEDNLIDLYKLYSKINYPYFYKLDGIAKYKNNNYYFIDNKVYTKDNFMLDDKKCKINKNNKIVCYNNEFEVRFK